MLIIFNFYRSYYRGRISNKAIYAKMVSTVSIQIQTNRKSAIRFLCIVISNTDDTLILQLQSKIRKGQGKAVGHNTILCLGCVTVWIRYLFFQEHVPNTTMLMIICSLACSQKRYLKTRFRFTWHCSSADAKVLATANTTQIPSGAR